MIGGSRAVSLPGTDQVILPLLDLDDEKTARLRRGLSSLGLLDSEPHGRG